jgi:hypothetical protein
MLAIAIEAAGESMHGKGGWLWLAVGVLSLWGCATPSAPPTPSAPYAMLELPASIRLLTLDNQAVDARTQRQTLLVSPGRHTLQLMYVAMGTNDSRMHDGQLAGPVALEVQEGFRYRLMAKT